MSQANVAGRARQLMSQCGADSITLFVFGGAGAAPQVTYVHTAGVPDDVNELYRKTIHLHDPFLASRRLLCGRSASGTLVIDRARAESLCDPAELGPYRKFMQRFGYCESLAAISELAPGTALVAGLLKQGRGGGRNKLSARAVGGEIEHLLGEAAGEVLQSALRLYQQDAEQIATEPLRGRYPGLTAREGDVVVPLREGCSNKQIAARLGLSELTIENNLRRIYRKFNVHSRTALMAALSDSELTAAGPA